MRNVVIGFLGTQLDAGKRRKWRPSVCVCAHEDLPVDRLELLYDRKFSRLAHAVKRDIEALHPETEVLLQRLDLHDPWDFQEVYGALFDFAQSYGFDEDREKYHVHLTTGTHVAQICWFLLTEARHVPARLLQTSPPRGDDLPDGSFNVIDLDLRKYDALQQRFDQVERASDLILKGGIDTADPAFNALIAQVQSIATTSKAPMLLVGETGTGKSDLAQRIYELKLQRRLIKGRFVQINCATLRGPKAMAQLLGERRSGGQDRRGLLREADGGVLFLDGIDQLDTDAQAIVLQAIETGKFYPVGSDHEVTTRFHLIAGSTQPLGPAVGDGAFRGDLFASLSMWCVDLPPLRARRVDMVAHIEHELTTVERLLGERVGFNTDAAQAYFRFARDPGSQWSGNFRDLRASIQRLCTLAPRGRITTAMVERETKLLRAQWRSAARDVDHQLLVAFLGEQAAQVDPFDVPQLANVIRVCRTSATLSAAGRTLFAASRAQKASKNDADRLRKYLARFDLSWDALQ